MRNPIPAQISFINAERPILNIKKPVYPFDKLVADGQAMLIKNRNPESVKSAVRTFLKTNPGFHISVEQRKANVLVFRWKEANRLTIKAPLELSAGAPRKRGRPANADKEAAKAVLAATAPVNQQLEMVLPTSGSKKARKTGPGITNPQRIYELHEEGKTYAEISSILTISQKSVQRGIKQYKTDLMLANQQ